MIPIPADALGFDSQDIQTRYAEGELDHNTAFKYLEALGADPGTAQDTLTAWDLDKTVTFQQENSPESVHGNAMSLKEYDNLPAQRPAPVAQDAPSNIDAPATTTDTIFPRKRDVTVEPEYQGLSALGNSYILRSAADPEQDPDDLPFDEEAARKENEMWAKRETTNPSLSEFREDENLKWLRKLKEAQRDEKPSKSAPPSSPEASVDDLYTAAANKAHNRPHVTPSSGGPDEVVENPNDKLAEEIAAKLIDKSDSRFYDVWQAVTILLDQGFGETAGKVEPNPAYSKGRKYGQVNLEPGKFGKELDPKSFEGKGILDILTDESEGKRKLNYDKVVDVIHDATAANPYGKDLYVDPDYIAKRDVVRRYAPPGSEQFYNASSPSGENTETYAHFRQALNLAFPDIAFPKLTQILTVLDNDPEKSDAAKLSAVRTLLLSPEVKREFPTLFQWATDYLKGGSTKNYETYVEPMLRRKDSVYKHPELARFLAKLDDGSIYSDPEFSDLVDVEPTASGYTVTPASKIALFYDTISSDEVYHDLFAQYQAMLKARVLAKRVAERISKNPERADEILAKDKATVASSPKVPKEVASYFASFMDSGSKTFDDSWFYDQIKTLVAPESRDRYITDRD